MQCPSCTFENLPHLANCARCGSPLMLAEVCVEPPRAGRFRVATRAARLARNLRYRIPDVTGLGRWLHDLSPEPVSGKALAWTLIPGLGHLVIGRHRTGFILLGVWLMLMMSALALIGVNMAWFLMSLAIAVHAAAFTTLFAASLAYERFLMRLAFGGVLFVLAYLLLYWPPIWFVGHFAHFVPLVHVPGGGPLAADDVLLTEAAWTRSESFTYGDIVLYRVHRLIRPDVYGTAGHGIDRVVGLPGDHIVVQDGTLLVNGTAPPAFPLGPINPQFVLDHHIRPAEYAIIPSQFGFHLGDLPGGRAEAEIVSASIICVAERNVAGKVLYRVRPWSRFGPLE